MGDRTRRAVQRFIGLSRPDRASERHKGGNTEVDIATVAWVKVRLGGAQLARHVVHALKRLTTTLSLVSTHPHPFHFAPCRRCMVKILRKGYQLETR